MESGKTKKFVYLGAGLLLIATALVVGCQQAPAPSPAPPKTTAPPATTAAPKTTAPATTAVPTTTAPATTAAPKTTTPAATGQTWNLRVNTYMANAKHQTAVYAMLPFAEAVNKRTNGRVSMQFFYADQLGPRKEIYQSTASGVNDLGLYVTSDITGRLPLTETLQLPGLFASGELASTGGMRLAQSGLLDKEYNDSKLLGISSTSPNQLFTKKQVLTLADLKGLKIRQPGGPAAEYWKAMGATPVTLAATDLYNGLTSGIVDGTQLTIATSKVYNLQEVTKYVLLINLGQTSQPLVANLKTWNSFPKDIQDIIMDEAAKAMVNNGKGYDASDEEVAKAYRAVGVVFNKPTNPEEWKTAIKPLIDKWISDLTAKGLPAQQVYDKAAAK